MATGKASGEKPSAGNPRVCSAKRLLVLACTASAACFGKVFDDATCLHYGMVDFPANPAANTYYSCYPDYRHYSTFGTGGSHKLKITKGNDVVNLSAATCDVYSPTLGRTLTGEPCLRMDQTINVSANGNTNYTHGAWNTSGAGIPSTCTNYTILARFRPNMKDWYANGIGGDWPRLLVLSSTYGNATKAGRGMFIGLVPNAGSTNGHIVVRNGGMKGSDNNDDFKKTVFYDGVWNELAVIVSNGTVRIGICNEKINAMAGDSRMVPYPGQWVWQSKDFTPVTAGPTRPYRTAATAATST